MKNAKANKAPSARRMPIARPAFPPLDMPPEDPVLAAAVWLGVVELVDSRNEEVGEGEDACVVAAAAGVCVDEVAAFRGVLVGAVFLLSGVEVI